MTEQLENQGVEELKIGTIYEKLDQIGKETLISMSHFDPESGGTKDAMLATTGMDDETFEKGFKELKTFGLASKGKPQVLRESILLRAQSREELRTELADLRRNGFIDAKEEESFYLKFMHTLDKSTSIPIIPAIIKFQEDPEGSRYRLNRHSEIAEFLVGSKIAPAGAFASMEKLLERR